MAITLRDNTPNNTGKGSELTYLEMDTNLESFYYSSSLSGSSLELFTTGSTCHVVDLSSAIGSGGTGAQGVQGIQGAAGAGTQGIQGPAGSGGGSSIQGVQGIQGTAGTGAQGTSGTGAQGAQGTAGASGGSTLTRPSTDDQAITFVDLYPSYQATWVLQSTSGATPTSTGITWNSTSVSSITQVKIYHTPDSIGGFTGNLLDALNQLEYGGAIQLGDSNDPQYTATGTIRKSVDNGTYHTIYVSNMVGSLPNVIVGTGILVGFNSDKAIVLDDKPYNRIKVRNNAVNYKNVRIKANPAASAGDYYLVEITADTSNSLNMLFEYVHYHSGTNNTYAENVNEIYYFNNNFTASTPPDVIAQANISNGYHQLILEFRVTPNGDLALMGADKVIR